MEFGFTPAQEALRYEVRAFIAKEVMPEVLAEMADHDEGHPMVRANCQSPHLVALFKKIADRGWVGMSYPREYGGQGADRISQYIVEE